MAVGQAHRHPVVGQHGNGGDDGRQAGDLAWIQALAAQLDALHAAAAGVVFAAGVEVVADLLQSVHLIRPCGP